MKGFSCKHESLFDLLALVSYNTNNAIIFVFGGGGCPEMNAGCHSMTSFPMVSLC